MLLIESASFWLIWPLVLFSASVEEKLLKSGIYKHLAVVSSQSSSTIANTMQQFTPKIVSCCLPFCYFFVQYQVNRCHTYRKTTGALTLIGIMRLSDYMRYYHPIVQHWMWHHLISQSIPLFKHISKWQLLCLSYARISSAYISILLWLLYSILHERFYCLAIARFIHTLVFPKLPYVTYWPANLWILSSR